VRGEERKDRRELEGGGGEKMRWEGREGRGGREFVLCPKKKPQKSAPMYPRSIISTLFARARQRYSRRLPV